ncbi:hypothetical protein HK098_005723 [Nowakowskiella sp. JEL0407]|nr:hypothetical protein HK098_005723 [Nowakowskiella sp. JEL0407]
MKSGIVFLVLFALPLLAFARREWDEKDYQIFDLNDALTKTVGPDATFYSILQSDPSASINDLNKAYRKVSRQYHPDKNTEASTEKIYQMLTSIMAILKDQGAREKYDFHLKNGFPTWKGTGYYYTRYKPGVFTVIFIIVLFVSVGQYASAWGMYYRDGLLLAAEDSKKPKKVSKKPLKKVATKSSPSVNDVKVSLEDLKAPSVFDTLIFQIPLYCWSFVPSGNKEDVNVEDKEEKTE